MATRLVRAQEAMGDRRLQDLIRFYSILNQLEKMLLDSRAQRLLPPLEVSARTGSDGTPADNTAVAAANLADVSLGI
jgi:hypothetical protein